MNNNIQLFEDGSLLDQIEWLAGEYGCICALKEGDKYKFKYQTNSKIVSDKYSKLAIQLKAQKIHHDLVFLSCYKSFSPETLSRLKFELEFVSKVSNCGTFPNL